MAETIGLAGLSVSIFDQLLKLTERTAVLIQDAKAFGVDSNKFFDLLNHENNRNKLLRLLLFSPSPIYGGTTLYESFDDGSQEDVKILLGSAINGLNEGFDILQGRYCRRYKTRGDTFISDPFSLHSLSSVSDSSTPTSLISADKDFIKKSPLNILMWSFRDKRRIEAIIREFTDLNGRIHEKIKLCCLVSSLGLNLPHLLRLRDDQVSKSLGFDLDATIRLTAIDQEDKSESLELDDSWIKFIKPTESKENGFFISRLRRDRQCYLQECHPVEPGHPVNVQDDLCRNQSLDLRTRHRIDSLARILHQPKESVFRIPPCVGWKYLPVNSIIVFVFRSPSVKGQKPDTLFDLLSNKQIKPSLGDKFRLALNLANSIAQLHMVRWVHESFRSENILFFPESDSDHPCTSANIAEPWIFGFTFSRPEAFFSAGTADFTPSRDVYRHPNRQGQPTETFTKIHDIYSLGVVLLEIGLWEPAISLEKNMFQHVSDTKAVQMQLRKHADKRLEPRMGRKYKDIVLKCLCGSFYVEDDTKEDLKLQQAFRTQVVDVLENIASVL